MRFDFKVVREDSDKSSEFQSESPSDILLKTSEYPMIVMYLNINRRVCRTLMEEMDKSLN